MIDTSTTLRSVASVPDALHALPTISVIIPVYNASRDLRRCLRSLHAQDYPADRLEIIVVDDDSTDDTREVAAASGAHVLRNGHRNIEYGKSIGLAQTTGELIFLLDSDNRLPTTDWLRCAATALMRHPEAVGVQAARFHYNPDDPTANRYCSLFGIGDPVAYYLKKQDHLGHLQRTWTLQGKVISHYPEYDLVRFTPETMPTLGSQGFLTRKSLLLQTNWTPALFHVDSNLQLVMAGHNLYVILHRAVIHDYVHSLAHLTAKLERNATLFFGQQTERTHVWKMSRVAVAMALLKMVTLIVPFRDALRGYRTLRDPAWFYHPLLCIYIPIVYAMIFARSKTKRKATP